MRKVFYVFECGRAVESANLVKRPIKKSIVENAIGPDTDLDLEEYDRLRHLHFCHQCGARLAFRRAKCSDCENDVIRSDSRGIVAKRCPTCMDETNKLVRRAKAQTWRDREKEKREPKGQIRRGDYCKEKLSKCINCGRTRKDQKGCIDCEYYRPVWPGHDPVPLARVMGVLPKQKKRKVAA